MNERDEVRLRDMLDASQKAQKFIDGKNRADLEYDDMLLFALVRAIEIIGEAAKNVTEETSEALTQIPWKKIIGMRNRLTHGYQEVDHDIVWDAATVQIPALITELEKILSAE